MSIGCVFHFGAKLCSLVSWCHVLDPHRTAPTVRRARAGLFVCFIRQTARSGVLRAFGWKDKEAILKKFCHELGRACWPCEEEGS